MRILTKDELWRCFLHKAPAGPVSMRETEKIYFPGEIGLYLHMIRTEPRRAFTCIGGLVLILLIMFGLIFMAGLAQDPIATLNSQPALIQAASEAAK